MKKWFGSKSSKSKTGDSSNSGSASRGSSATTPETYSGQLGPRQLALLGQERQSRAPTLSRSLTSRPPVEQPSGGPSATRRSVDRTSSMRRSEDTPSAGRAPTVSRPPERRVPEDTPSASRPPIVSRPPVSTRRLFTESEGPTSSRPLMRMPHMDHPVPSPISEESHETGGSRGSGSSNTVGLSPPESLFLPNHIPAIPLFDPATGNPIPGQAENVPLEAAYIYTPFPRPLFSARIANQLTDDSGVVVNAKSKKTRSTVSGKGLEWIGPNNRLPIQADRYGDVIESQASVKYGTQAGCTVRDHVPMLWPEWGYVPQEVKDAAHFYLSVS